MMVAVEEGIDGFERVAVRLHHLKLANLIRTPNLSLIHLPPPDPGKEHQQREIGLLTRFHSLACP